MVILAKFDSRCRCCYKQLYKGDTISWSPGQKADCIECMNTRSGKLTPPLFFLLKIDKAAKLYRDKIPS